MFIDENGSPLGDAGDFASQQLIDYIGVVRSNFEAMQEEIDDVTSGYRPNKRLRDSE